jgi:hypothetical protein
MFWIARFRYEMWNQAARLSAEGVVLSSLN